MRVRRSVAVLVLVLTFVGAGALVAFAAQPPPPVLPHPPPIAATFTVYPDAGPVGTTVTIQGACGFAATTLMYGVNEQRPDGTFTIWLPTEFAPLTPNPLGQFKVSFTFPSNGNVSPDFGGIGNAPILPGTYYVGATCASPETPLPMQPFTVTASGTKPPPPVLPHPPPITATLSVHPDSGPAGTSVTMQGTCGFAAHQLLWGIEGLDENGEETTVWFPSEWPLLNPTPLGVFSVTFTFPSTGNFATFDGVPLLPGSYFVGGFCFPGPIEEGGGVLLPMKVFTLTASKR